VHFMTCDVDFIQFSFPFLMEYVGAPCLATAPVAMTRQQNTGASTGWQTQKIDS
jgi:hypothetical protein